MASTCTQCVNDARKHFQAGAKAGVARTALPRPARVRCVSVSAQSQSTMRVGLPKEIKNHEYRVGMTPANVATLTEAGHAVCVETGAGEELGGTARSQMKEGAPHLQLLSQPGWHAAPGTLGLWP